ncbi:hypothetical protein GCM10011309_10370 [Litorimonas cladophorae]|uniref:DUF805 domain-containing protein n=1 Tax=Litorimonas cladophorae TaxID=1220491 RepID=A0A918KIE0_9PROT|nr:DUF805 domain-containing protein [Litorimonas cladophorae]GGX62329.1 hypothetical protein GCM10011309_10370 [Litorimonas cladophorae]
MGNLLFSPSGRIGPAAFMKGMMVLAAISAIISLTGLFSFQISQLLGYVSFLLIIPSFFLLIKRSHDAGKSGWMSIVWFLLWLVIVIVISMILGAVMPGAAEAEMKLAMEARMAGATGFGEIMEITKEITDEFGPALAKQAAIPSAIASLVATGIAAFLINMFNKSDAHDNQFGPATTGDS